MKSAARLVIWLYAFMLLPSAMAQTAADKPFSKEELEQIAAPIALYPDPLVAQVFMASTYPLEVVSAARWSKANSGVHGKALEDAMQSQPWDASVKSLTAFPQVLEMMNAKLDWTQKLGDAFLAQQQELMAAVQILRTKADAAGNLKSTKEQVVAKEQQGNTTYVTIQPANPEVVYVPTYNPAVVYGAWPYPAAPPYAYYPPGYAPGAALLTFGVGMAVGAALWGNTNWGGGDVNINSSRYNNFNKTNIQNGKWQHQAEHRKGAGYRDSASREKFGRGQQSGAEARESFRGRAEQGRQDISRGGADRFKQDGIGGQRGGLGDGRGGAGGRGDFGGGDRGGIGGDRGGMGGGAVGGGDRGGRGSSFGNRPDTGMRPTAGGGGFQGLGGGGAQTRNFSDRGASSRASAGGGGGGARAGGGGGGARGGGGGGGGGRGGGGGGGGGRGGGGRR